MTDELPVFPYDDHTSDALLDEVTGEVERTDGAVARMDAIQERTDSGSAT